VCCCLKVSVQLEGLWLLEALHLCVCKVKHFCSSSIACSTSACPSQQGKQVLCRRCQQAPADLQSRHRAKARSLQVLALAERMARPATVAGLAGCAWHSPLTLTAHTQSHTL